MASLNEDKFQSILDDLWEQLNKYEAKFGDKFEICFLVSKAMQEFRRPTKLSSYVTRDPFDCYTYLLGRRVIFTDQEYIPSFTSDPYGLIEPVICCKDAYTFPMAAEPGDYVFYAGNLKQVVDITLDDGDRSVHIRDVPGDFSDDAYACANAVDRLVDQWIRYTKYREQKRDSWMADVDNAEINEYLSSLTIT